MAGQPFLARFADVRPQERAMLGRVAASFTLIQSSHAFGANAADALFFLRYGIDRLPQWIVVSGVAVMAVVLGHTAGIGALGPRRWLPLATLATALWAAAGWVGVIFDVPGIYAIVWVSTQAIMIATITIMWNTAGAVCTIRQAKRLFPLFAAAGIAGAIAGNLLTGPLAAILGTENLLVIQAAALLGGSLLVVRSRRYFMAEKPAPESFGREEIKATARSVGRSRFLSLAALVALATNLLYFLVYFPFSGSVAESFASESEVAAFLGVFASIATASTFLFSLVITRRLFTRLGIVLAMLIVPLVYAAGFALWLGTFSLATAALVRGVQWVATNAVGATAYPALFTVITGRRRGEITAFMTAVPAQIGVVLGGLLLMVLARFPDPLTFGLGFATAVAFAVLVVGMRPSYVDAIVEAVRRGVVGVFDAPAPGLFTPADADAHQVLVSHLRDPRASARAVAVSGLARLHDMADPESIEPLLDDSDPLVRGAAFETMCTIDPTRVSSHAATAITDDAPDVRLQVLHYLAANPGGNWQSVASASLDDPDLRVRAAAAIVVGGRRGADTLRALVSGDDPVGIEAALEEVLDLEGDTTLDPLPLLDHEDPAVRVAAVRLAAARGSPPGVIRRLVADPSPRVRAGAAGLLALTRDGSAALLDLLATGSVLETEAALNALTPVDEMTPQFVQWARDEAERAAHLMACQEALGDESEDEDSAYLLRVLSMRIDRLLGWVLRATATRETASVMTVVERGVHSSSPETKAQATEALEAIGDRAVISVLLPLLEPDHVAGSSTRMEALETLAGDFDPWISRLARSVLDRGTTPGHPVVASFDRMPPSNDLPGLSPFEKVLVLQQVPMFAELDPEDLEMVAGATTERHYEGSAPVYRAGEVGEEMMVIVAGSVVVSVAEGASRRVIETYGPGEHVGELSLLGVGVRSADVASGEAGAHGLILTKSELMSVLEERPSVTMGLLATLAKRIAGQTAAK